MRVVVIVNKNVVRKEPLRASDFQTSCVFPPSVMSPFFLNYVWNDFHIA
jgi:hypothetical protein